MQQQTADKLAPLNPPNDISQFLRSNLTEKGLRQMITDAANLSPEQQLAYRPEELGKRLGYVPVLMPPQNPYPEAFLIQYKMIKARNKSVWSLVTKEIHLLVAARGPGYSRLRRKLLISPTDERGIVAMISASVGSRVGVPATLVTPAIAAALLIELAKPQVDTNVDD